MSQPMTNLTGNLAQFVVHSFVYQMRSLCYPLDLCLTEPGQSLDKQTVEYYIGMISMLVFQSDMLHVPQPCIRLMCWTRTNKLKLGLICVSAGEQKITCWSFGITFHDADNFYFIIIFIYSYIHSVNRCRYFFSFYLLAYR